MEPSKSTDKLAIICETINQKILSDETLKTRVKSMKIDWKEVGHDIQTNMFVPVLDIEFKE